MTTISKDKVFMLSLGCDKNRVDGEKLLYGMLKNSVYTDDPADADIIVVNTCAFIESAKTESIDAILELAEHKKNGRCKKLIVAGCLSMRYGKQLEKLLPEADEFITDITTDCDRILTTPNHYSYLKIAEGCDNNCTYCAIPSIRGRYRSEKIENLFDETKYLIDEYGIKELNLVAQDLTRYGVDLYNEYALIKLLEKLSELDIKRIRLLYCYPELTNNELIKYVTENPKICDYFDIPLQHISDNVLKRMNRRITGREIKNLLENIRKINKNAVIRSAFIAGFNGETESDFKELQTFLTDYKLDYAGFFAYSAEENTPAVKLDGKIPERVKIARREKLYEIQSKIMEDNADKKVGDTVEVLFEGFDGESGKFFGRTALQAPSVDPVVYLNSKISLTAGEFYKVAITGRVGFDLIGDVVIKE